MRVAPLTLADANAYIAAYHRHHKPVQGHRFSIAALDEVDILGVAVVGRPVARNCNQWLVAEVTRLCTTGGTNVCSYLYAACARICKEMGFAKIQTYILDTEPGTTLKASGWVFESDTRGGAWERSEIDAKPRRTDQPQQPKQRWAKTFWTQ